MSTAITRAHDFTDDRDGGTKILSASVDAEFDVLFAAANQKVQAKTTAPSGPADGDSWVDLGQDPPVLKFYDATNTAWVSSSQDLSDISTDAGVDEDLADAMENFIDGCFIYRVDGDNVGCTIGSVMINGKLRRLTSAIVNRTYTIPTDEDWLDIWAVADTAATTFTLTAVDSGAAPGGSANPATTAGRMIGSIKYIDSTSKITETIQFRNGFIQGWASVVGDGDIANSATVTFGKTFDVVPSAVIDLHGKLASAAVPNDPGDSDSSLNIATAHVSGAGTHSTTAMTVEIRTETGATFTNLDHHIFSWVAYGRYS